MRRYTRWTFHEGVGRCATFPTARFVFWRMFVRMVALPRPLDDDDEDILSEFIMINQPHVEVLMPDGVLYLRDDRFTAALL